MNPQKLMLTLVVVALQALPLQAKAAEITVSAAASLTQAFTEIKEQFSEKTGHSVVTNFAASNPLLQQIREGAPVDVFASADQVTMDKAAEYKLINASTRKNFALNSLVVIVPKESQLVEFSGASADLATYLNAELGTMERIALGSPDSVPAGRYARDSLQSHGLYDALQAKYIFGNSVRQVLDYVSRGEVDAGFVYATDALTGLADPSSVRIVATMTGHPPVSYPIAVCAHSAQADVAAQFIDFVLSDEGLTVLKKYGFSDVK